MDVVILVYDAVFHPTNNGCRIYMDIMTGEKLLLGCYFPSHLMVSSIIQKEKNECGKKGRGVDRYFSLLQGSLY